MCKKDEAIVMLNSVALHAAGFLLAAENHQGADIRPPRRCAGLSVFVQCINIHAYTLNAHVLLNANKMCQSEGEMRNVPGHNAHHFTS